ncbi:MAG: ferric reductase-like transmembrane domain-containing protein [Actinomycetales bacterium]
MAAAAPAATVQAPVAVPAGSSGASERDPRPARSGARHRAAPPVTLVRHRTRQVVTVAAAAVVALAVLLWAVDGGLAALSSPALAVESVGRLAGMAGSALLALLVVLVAGVPAIENAFGRARLQRWHVAVGATSFSLVVGHAFLAVAASALVEDDSVLEAAWRLLSDFPATTLAAVGLALLVLVVVTSRAAARATRGRDAWHLLHLYGYLGVFLALPHLVVTSGLPGALYWLALYLAAAGAVVVWRVQSPLARSLRHQLVVSEVLPESDATVTVVLQGRRLDELAALPGSVARLRFLDGRRWFAVHSAALQSAPTGSQVRLSVVRSVGDGRPAGVARGTWVLLEGPSSVFTADSRTRERVAVLAAGTGVTPLRALLDDLPYDAGNVVVVHRVHEAARAPFRDDLSDLSLRRGVEVIPLEGPRSAARASWLPADAAERIGDAEAITHLVADIADRDVYVSGPPEWVALVLKALRAAGVPADQVHADSFVG